MGIRLDTGSRMNDIFLAFGDSFTWGHGLQYYDWIQNSKMSKEEIKDFLLEDQQSLHHQWANFDFKCSAADLESMRKRRYTTLLSKELGRDYISRINNGGSNFANTHMIKTLLGDDYPDNKSRWKKANHSLNNDKLMNRKIKFIILQLTDLERDYKSTKELRVHAGELEHVRSMIGSWWDTYVMSTESGGIFNPNKKSIQVLRPFEHRDAYKYHQLLDSVTELYEICKKKDIKLYVWAWPGDIGQVFLSQPYFVEIEYDNKKYGSYDNLTNSYPKFSLGKKGGDLEEYGVTDEHPSEHFHKLISKILLNKINGDK
jgi:hypothetical protein